MKEKMKIFTIERGKVTEGVKVDSFTLKGAGVSIPAIIVGGGRQGGENSTYCRSNFFPNNTRNGKRMSMYISIPQSWNN